MAYHLQKHKYKNQKKIKIITSINTYRKSKIVIEDIEIRFQDFEKSTEIVERISFSFKKRLKGETHYPKNFRHISYGTKGIRK